MVPLTVSTLPVQEDLQRRAREGRWNKVEAIQYLVLVFFYFYFFLANSKYLLILRIFANVLFMTFTIIPETSGLVESLTLLKKKIT